MGAAVSDVAQWLEALGLGQYAPTFAENGIDRRSLPHLTERDFEVMGVLLGHRRLLLAAIAELRTDGRPVGDNEDLESSSDRPSPAIAPEAERRQLTVMFCDLVGSTELSIRLDPEDLRQVILTYQRTVAAEVERQGGRVAKYMGDGVLAYFGYPRAQEDEAERAVRAGLAIVEAVASLAPAAGRPLGARVGIATGLVVVGDLIGAGMAQELAVVGETPNLAARLQAIAEPGSVVIAPDTRQLLGALFEIADLGRRTIKGMADPLQIWRVLGEGHSEGRFAALRGGALSPLVGRDEELQLLLARWRRAVAGEGQLVLLSGEAGIGKSRVTEGLIQSISEPHVELRFYASPHSIGSTLRPVVEQLERVAGFDAGDSAQTKLAKLETYLDRAAVSRAETVPHLAAFLSIPLSDRYSAPELSPGARKAKTLEALVDLIVGQSARLPALVILEDAHWFDSTTTELIGAVIERLSDLRILVLCTCRPEFAPPWAGHGAAMTALTLGRLGLDQARAIVERITDGIALPREVLEQILAKTDGVPLFVEELTKTVLESDKLRKTGARYVLTGSLPELAIPATLQDSLLARLDRLDSAKDVAQIGAVIGREFSYRLLAAATDPDDAQLGWALARLVESELVFQRGDPPESRYSFKHALVQDAAYQSLLKSKRQRLHARIAKVIEEQFPETAQTEPEILAQHYSQAREVSRAVKYWRFAGERAAQRSANVEAAVHLRKGLELLETRNESDDRDRTELSLLIALGPALMATDGWEAPEVDRVYSRARHLARKTDQTGVLYPSVWGLWLVAHAGGAAERARTLLAELFELAHADDDRNLLLQAHHAGGSTRCSDGDLHEAQRHIDAGIALYRTDLHADQALQYGGHDPFVCAHSLGALNQFMLGQLDAAEDYSRKALETAGAISHRASAAHAYLYRAELSHIRNRPTEAEELANRVLEIAEPLGIAHYSAWALLVIGWSRAVQGQIETGLSDGKNGLARLRVAGMRYHLPHRLTIWAETLAATGRTQEALQAIDEALAMVDETGEHWFEAEVLRRKAGILRQADRDAMPEVGRLLERAIAAAAAIEAKLWKLRATKDLACLWQAQGKTEEAFRLIEPVYAGFTEGLETPDLIEARTLMTTLT